MQQFIITSPNPYKGEGSKGLDRVAPEGEPTVNTWVAYANTEPGAKRLLCESLGMQWSPDGTSVTWVANEPRVTKETIINMADFLTENLKYKSNMSDMEKASTLIDNSFVHEGLLYVEVNSQAVPVDTEMVQKLAALYDFSN